MTFKRISRHLLVLALALLIAGTCLELSARLAETIGFAQTVQVDNERRETRPLDQLFESEPTAYRILVLGDSMAYSPGLAAADVWSTALQRSLEKTLEMEVEVVNAARGGDNTYGQLQFLKASLGEHGAQARNAPDLVLLLYNHNDVYGARQAPKTNRSEPATSTTTPPLETRPERQQSLAQVARRLRQNSKFGELLLTRLGNQSRAWGYLVPGTEFHHLATKAYRSGSPVWLAVQRELEIIEGLVSDAGGKLAMFVLPQFASLKHDFFMQARAEIQAVSTRLDVPIGFGFPEFKDRTWQELAMSPFDGHPNARANQEIAIVVEQWLLNSRILDHQNPAKARLIDTNSP